MNALTINALLLALMLVSAGADDDRLIVPGERIGNVELGMGQAELLELLGAPHRQDDLGVVENLGKILGEKGGDRVQPSLAGVMREDWITPVPIARDVNERSAFMSEFLTVYLRDARVVQIEVRSSKFKTRAGDSTSSSAETLRGRHPNIVSSTLVHEHPSSAGIPATKHFVTCEDAVEDGIGWRYGAFGNLAPDPDPTRALETIVVHPAGTALLPDPDGGSRFVWKSWPLRRDDLGAQVPAREIRRSPDGRHFAGWFDHDAGAPFGVVRSIVVRSASDPYDIFSRVSVPRYTDAAWNPASNKCVLADAPDNGGPKVWVIYRKSPSEWASQEIEPFASLEEDFLKADPEVTHLFRPSIQKIAWLSETEVRFRGYCNTGTYFITMDTAAPEQPVVLEKLSDGWLDE